MALWTLAEQQMIKPLDSNNQHKFEQLQREVEINDIEKYLGFEFYQELIRNAANYAVLLNGGTYTYNSLVYRFDGLKYVCAYLLYARYVRQSYINDTFSGMMVHTTDGMQRVGAGEMANQEARYKEIAGTAWEGCVRYLRTIDIEIRPERSNNRRTKIDYL